MGIMAELHGKISSTGSNITDTMEDLLTSNVFQLLRYIPIQHGLIPILTKAENVEDDDISTVVRLSLPDNINRAVYHFWRRFDNCEPDLFIELMQEYKLIANILIEAKYLSGKSGTPVFEDDQGKTLYIAGSDQLEREWTVLKNHSAESNTPFYLIYLTMDWVMPKDAIEESIQVIEKDSRKEIYWLNWQSINSTLKEILCMDVNDETMMRDKVIIQDIVELLSKKGLKEFAGYKVITEHNLKPIQYFTLKYYDAMKSINLKPINYFKGA
jgi:hypothetical protein